MYLTHEFFVFYAARISCPSFYGFLVHCFANLFALLDVLVIDSRKILLSALYVFQLCFMRVLFFHGVEMMVSLK